MNIKNLLCIVTAVALFGAGTAQAQGLTDLAKAEKKRRAQVQKTGGAAKVYTEADKAGGSSDGGVSVASAPEAAGAPGAPAAAPGTKKEKTPEEVAAEKQKEWNDKVTAAQGQITELEAAISRNERNLASMINITPARQDLANSIEADKKKLGDLRQSLVALEDERRRAGMPRR